VDTGYTLRVTSQTSVVCSGCDNSRTYVPEVRQYYCLVLLCFQPRTT
jgi:hypothetical protein